MPDFIALRGDPSDRIPGAPGVGPKKAAELLVQYGSLEDALAAGRFPTIAEELRLYRRIATLDVSAPLPPLEDQSPAWAEASSLFRALGRERSWPAGSPSAPDHPVEIVSHAAFSELHPTFGHPEAQERLAVLHRAFPTSSTCEPGVRGRAVRVPLAASTSSSSARSRTRPGWIWTRSRPSDVVRGGAPRRGRRHRGGQARRLRARPTARPPCAPPSARWASACSRTWRLPHDGRSGTRRSSAWRSSTSTSTTATAPRRSSAATTRSCSSRSTSGRSGRAPAGPTTRPQTTLNVPMRAGFRRRRVHAGVRARRRAGARALRRRARARLGRLRRSRRRPARRHPGHRGRLPRARAPVRGGGTALRRRARGRVQPRDAARARRCGPEGFASDRPRSPASRGAGLPRPRSPRAWPRRHVPVRFRNAGRAQTAQRPRRARRHDTNRDRCRAQAARRRPPRLARAPPDRADDGRAVRAPPLALSAATRLPVRRVATRGARSRRGPSPSRTGPRSRAADPDDAPRRPPAPRPAAGRGVRPGPGRRLPSRHDVLRGRRPARPRRGPPEHDPHARPRLELGRDGRVVLQGRGRRVGARPPTRGTSSRARPCPRRLSGRSRGAMGRARAADPSAR